jgi:hypothetical protein
MNSEDNLRRFLKERFDAEELTPAEGDWESARQFVDARKRGSRQRLIVMMLLTLISITMLVYFSPGDDSGKTADVVTGGAKEILSNESVQKPESSTIVQHDNTVDAVAPAQKTIRTEARPNAGRIHGEAEKNQTVVQIIEGPAPASYESVSDQKDVSDKDAENTANKITEGSVSEVRAEELIAPIVTEAVSLPETKSEPIIHQASVVIPDQPIALVEEKVPVPVAVITTDSLASAQLTTKEIDAAGDSILSNDLRPSLVACEGVYYELGAGWLYGWDYAAAHDARGFTPVAGINYANRLDNKRAISFGVQYAMVPNLSVSSRTSRTTSFGFGEETRVTVITPVTLHYLVAPFRLHYYIARGNVVGGGVNVGYLLNVDARVLNYDERPGYTGNFETQKLSGYTEGFQWYDTQLSLFYRKDLCRSFGIQSELFLGLADVKQDQFFRQEAKERNSGFRITLIYFASTRSFK